MNPDSFLDNIIKMTDNELKDFLMANNYINREMLCEKCNYFMKLSKFDSVKEGFIWRCYNKVCSSYKKRISIRKNSFFSGFNKDIRVIFKIIIKWACGEQQHTIMKNLIVKKDLIRKVVDTILNKVEAFDFRNDKLGGHGRIVQIDENMLNYKCKSHRGRSPTNKTHAICLVEYDGHITRGMAKVIPNKEIDTIMPIICENVVAGSRIWTDESKSYNALIRNGFIHNTVCHKYEFVNKETGINTQAVESFNNRIKYEIKKQMGIKTYYRQRFLNEIVLKFNLKDNLVNWVLDIIKV